MGWWKNLLLNFNNYNFDLFQKVIALILFETNQNCSLQKLKLILDLKHVAQWIEHQIPILKVKGSIPFMLISFKNY